MESRMKNPAMILEVNPAIQAIMSPIYQSGISKELLEYVGLRVGQINNCELCISQSFVKSENNPTIKERIEDVLDWKASTAFDGTEQAAFELAEAITKLENKYNSVSDTLWLKLEGFFNEKELAALVLFISMMNMFTRINVATRQLTADWT